MIQIEDDNLNAMKKEIGLHLIYVTKALGLHFLYIFWVQPLIEKVLDILINFYIINVPSIILIVWAPKLHKIFRFYWFSIGLPYHKIKKFGATIIISIFAMWIIFNKSLNKEMSILVGHFLTLLNFWYFFIFNRKIKKKICETLVAMAFGTGPT